MPADIQAPEIAYGPTRCRCCIVFGAARLGVLVEAFVPAAQRRARCSSSSPSLGLAAALVAVVGCWPDDHEPARRRGRDRRRRPDAVPAGHARACSASSASCCSPSARSTAPAAPSSRRPRRCPARARTSRSPRARASQTEVFPLAMFALGGMLLFPACEQPAAACSSRSRCSRSRSTCWPGSPAAAACCRRRPRVKYFLLGAFASAFFLYGVALLYGYAGSVDLGDILDATGTAGSERRCCSTSASRCSPSACCSRSARCRSTPGRPTSTRARPTPVTALMAACTKVAAFGALLRVLYVGFGRDRVGLAADDVGRRDPHHGRRRDPRGHADRREADARLLLDRARRLHPAVGVVAAQPRRPVAARCSTCCLRLHDARPPSPS